MQIPDSTVKILNEIELIGMVKFAIKNIRQKDVEIIVNLAIKGKLYLTNNKEHNKTRKHEELAYIVNAIQLICLREQHAFKVKYDKVNKMVYFIGPGYLNLSTILDPISGKSISPQDNIDKTIQILATNRDAFNTAFFLTNKDDRNLPFFKAGCNMLSEKNMGKGVSFADYTNIKIAVIGESFYGKFGVTGVHECIAEEIHPWHYGMPFSLFKEGVTWALLGKLTESHPYEQRAIRENIKKSGGHHFWPLKDLIYNWTESRNSNIPSNKPHSVYTNGTIAFLLLAARNLMIDYDPKKYDLLAIEINRFCKMVYSAQIAKDQTSDPNLMMPILLKWAGFESEVDLYDFSNSKIKEFGKKLLKGHELI